jgi:hypothetical protein
VAQKRDAGANAEQQQMIHRKRKKGAFIGRNVLLLLFFSCFLLRRCTRRRVSNSNDGNQFFFLSMCSPSSPDCSPDKSGSIPFGWRTHSFAVCCTLPSGWRTHSFAVCCTLYFNFETPFQDSHVFLIALPETVIHITYDSDKIATSAQMAF